MLTRTNAKSVPMLVSSARMSMGRTPPGDGAHDAGDDRRDVRRAEARVHLRGHGREEPVVGHREEDPRLPEEHHQHDRREPGDGADLDGRREPELPGGLDADGDRVGNVELLVGNDARQDERDGDVEDRADAERDEDADGQVPLRVSRLLRGRRDGVEADVREEDHRRPLQDAGGAEAAEGARRWAGRTGASSRCARSARRRR